MQNGELLAVDYSRLTAVLWSVAKTQQELIKDLSTRVQALESPKTKTKTTAKAKKIN